MLRMLIKLPLVFALLTFLILCVKLLHSGNEHVTKKRPLFHWYEQVKEDRECGFLLPLILHYWRPFWPLESEAKECENFKLTHELSLVHICSLIFLAFWSRKFDVAITFDGHSRGDVAVYIFSQKYTNILLQFPSAAGAWGYYNLSMQEGLRDSVYLGSVVGPIVRNLAGFVERVLKMLQANLNMQW